METGRLIGWINEDGFAIVCTFGDQAPEMTLHILLGYIYSKEVWIKAHCIHPQKADISLGAKSVKSWWSKLNSTGPK
jgi:hypothetical protein